MRVVGTCRWARGREGVQSLLFIPKTGSSNREQSTLNKQINRCQVNKNNYSTYSRSVDALATDQETILLYGNCKQFVCQVQKEQLQNWILSQLTDSKIYIIAVSVSTNMLLIKWRNWIQYGVCLLKTINKFRSIFQRTTNTIEAFVKYQTDRIAFSRAVKYFPDWA